MQEIYDGDSEEGQMNKVRTLDRLEHFFLRTKL